MDQQILLPKQVDKDLEQIGWTKQHTILFWVCGAAWANDILWTINTAIIMEDCNDDFDISELARSNISTVFMVGLTISAYVWGALGDLKGRIWVFRRCVMVTLLGTILISVAWNFYVLIIAIFIVGIGLGGEITITGTVFMEFIPQSKIWTFSFICLFWGIGGMMSPLIALAVKYSTLPVSLWRGLCIICTLIEVLLLLSRFWVSETPKFLVNKGQLIEYSETLLVLKQDNTISKSVLENKHFYDEKGMGMETNWTLFLKLFHRENLRATIIIGIVIFTQTLFCFCYAMVAFSFFMPIFIKNTGVQLTQEQLYWTILCQQFFACLGLLLAAWLTRKIGYNYTIIIGVVISSILTYLFFFVKTYTIVILKQLLILSSSLVGIGQFGWSGLFTLNARLYKTYIRSTGVGWGNAMTKVGGLVSPLVTGLMFQMDDGFYMVLVTIAIMFCVVAISSFFFKKVD